MIAFRGSSLSVLLLLLAPQAAFAHGVQGRAETPIPIGAFFWAAGLVLVMSFVGLSLGWSTPKLTHVPWRRAPRSLERIVLSPVTIWIARVFVLAAVGFVFAAAAVGSTRLSKNIAPVSVFVVWWVGLVPVTALFGNIWRTVNPWATLARLLRFADRTRHPYPKRLGWWPAAVLLFVWAWLELVYTTPAQPRLIAGLIAAYTILNLAAMRRWGILPWLDHGEAFSVYSALLAHLSPVEVRHDAGQARLGFRPPVIAVTRIRPRPGMVAVVSVLIATVIFDGLSGSDVWTTRDVAAAERLITLGLPDFTAGIVVASLGLVASLVTIVVLYEGSSLASARAAGWPPFTTVGRIAVAFAHSLLPIALAYFIAHYFTLFVFQSQDLIRLASDPFGTGSDWFGTADRRIDFQLVSANFIWAVQVGAIVIGHIAGLALAHDRALHLSRSGHGEAIRSQWPMLVLMVLLTVAGLWSLSEGMAAV